MAQCTLILPIGLPIFCLQSRLCSRKPTHKHQHFSWPVDFLPMFKCMKQTCIYFAGLDRLGLGDFHTDLDEYSISSRFRVTTTLIVNILVHRIWLRTISPVLLTQYGYTWITTVSSPAYWIINYHRSIHPVTGHASIYIIVIKSYFSCKSTLHYYIYLKVVLAVFCSTMASKKQHYVPVFCRPSKYCMFKLTNYCADTLLLWS